MDSEPDAKLLESNTTATISEYLDTMHLTNKPHADTDAKRWLIQELMHTTTQHPPSPPADNDMHKNHPLLQPILSTEIQLVNSMHKYIQSVNHDNLCGIDTDSQNKQRESKRFKFSPTS